MSDKLSKKELIDISQAVLDFARTAENLDRLIVEATDSGIESGRLLGLYEAYDHMIKLGYTRSAKEIRSYIDEKFPALPPAKA
jgi:hypothetical protein